MPQVTFYCLVVSNLLRKFLYNPILVQNTWIFYFYRTSFRSGSPHGQASCPIVIGACIAWGQPFHLPLKPTQIIRGKSNSNSLQRHLTVTGLFLLSCSWEALGFISVLYGIPLTELTKRWFSLKKNNDWTARWPVTPGLSSLKASTPLPIHRSNLAAPWNFSLQIF